MKQKIATTIFSLFFLIVPAVGMAASIVPGADNPAKDSDYRTGTYSLSDMVGTFVGISQYILGIVGALALLGFIAGGVFLLISAGSQEMVTRGKSIIINSVIGLVIVFGSYLIVDFTVKGLGFEGSTFDIAEWSVLPKSATSETPKTTEAVAEEKKVLQLRLTEKLDLQREKCSDTIVSNECREIQKVITELENLIDTSSPLMLSGTYTQEIARKIESLHGTSISYGGASCESTGPEDTIRELASTMGQITICSNGCNANGGCNLSNNQSVRNNLTSILSQVPKVAGELSHVITSLTTGSHDARSKHYTGNAMDVSPVDKKKWQELRDKYNDIPGLCAECEVNGAYPSSCSNMSGSSPHVHVSTCL